MNNTRHIIYNVFLYNNDVITILYCNYIHYLILMSPIL